MKLSVEPNTRPVLTVANVVSSLVFISLCHIIKLFKCLAKLQLLRIECLTVINLLLFGT